MPTLVDGNTKDPGGSSSSSSADGPFTFTGVSGTNTIVGTSNGPDLAANQTFILIPAASNTGAVTLNGVAVKKSDGSTALSAGDLEANKAEFLLYDGSVFRLVEASVGLPILISQVTGLQAALDAKQNTPLSAADIRAAIVVTDNGNASDVNQIAAVGATVQEGLLLSVTLASPIYSNGSLYLALNGGTAYQAICASTKGGYRQVNTGEIEGGVPYLFQYSTVGGGRWILQSRSYITPGDMPGGMLFEATKKSGQTTSAAGTARLTWNAASRNDGHLTVSGTDNVTMTAVYTGVYEVNYTTFGTGNTGVIVYKNGSIFAIGSLIDGGSYPYICCLVPLTAGDTIEIYLYTASALTIDVSLAQARVLRIARVV